MGQHVHIGWEVDAHHLNLLSEYLGNSVTLTRGNHIPDHTQILIKGRPTESELASLPSLEALIIPFAGLPQETRTLLLHRQDISVYNTHHNASSTSEMAIALMLACCKRIPQYDDALRAGKWQLDTAAEPSSIHGKKALVMGFGAIGSKVARICCALNMKVSVLRREAHTTANEAFQHLSHETWRDHLPETDVLFLCLPATEETHNIISEAELSRLPNHACLVNIGRGTLVNEKALYESLRNRTLGSAGIDVWWNYPKSRKEDTCYPSRFPFHELPNVVMTPHRAGDLGDSSLENRRMVELSQIILDHFSGHTPSSLVDVQKGY